MPSVGSISREATTTGGNILGEAMRMEEVGRPPGVRAMRELELCGVGVWGDREKLHVRCDVTCIGHAIVLTYSQDTAAVIRNNGWC